MNIPEPVDTVIAQTEGAGRKAEANPFVDNGWLKGSYNGTGKEITVRAKEVADIVNLLRTAAKRLEYGLTLRVLIKGERWDSSEGIKILRAYRDGETIDEESYAVLQRNPTAKIQFRAIDRVSRPRKNKDNVTPAA